MSVWQYKLDKAIHNKIKWRWELQKMSETFVFSFSFQGKMCKCVQNFFVYATWCGNSMVTRCIVSNIAILYGHINGDLLVIFSPSFSSILIFFRYFLLFEWLPSIHCDNFSGSFSGAGCSIIITTFKCHYRAGLIFFYTACRFWSTWHDNDDSLNIFCSNSSAIIFR